MENIDEHIFMKIDLHSQQQDKHYSFIVLPIISNSFLNFCLKENYESIFEPFKCDVNEPYISSKYSDKPKLFNLIKDFNANSVLFISLLNGQIDTYNNQIYLLEQISEVKKYCSLKETNLVYEKNECMSNNLN